MEKMNASLELISKGDMTNSFFAESKYANVHKYSIFPKVAENVSHDLYKEQKVCIICKTKVGDLGVLDKKKYCCMFCFNAVCQSCSPLKCNHPETLKEERVCMQCYFSTIENQIKLELKTEIESRFGDDENRKQKESFEMELKDYENEITTLDIHLQNANEEVERLQRIKAKIQEEKRAKIKEAEEMNSIEINRLQEIVDKMKRDVNG
jgi:hypothetical protein